MSAKYRVVEDYYRQAHFDFYRRSKNPFYSISFDLDVTRLKRFVDERGYPTYVNLCYFFTRAMRPLEDFRYRYLDGRIVLYDEIHPGLAYPAADGLFSFVHLRYEADVDEFNRVAAAELPDQDAPACLATRDEKNYIYFTAIPNVPFTSFSHAWDETTDASPRVAFSDFARDGDRLKVTVGLQLNHMFVDGRPLGELYERAAEVFADPAGKDS